MVSGQYPQGALKHAALGLYFMASMCVWELAASAQRRRYSPFTAPGVLLCGPTPGYTPRSIAPNVVLPSGFARSRRSVSARISS